MVDWDSLEDAGHQFTHAGMLMAGRHLYYCEVCGALLLVSDDILLFHPPPGSLSTVDQCRGIGPFSETLQGKLRALEEAEWEKFEVGQED